MPRRNQASQSQPTSSNNAASQAQGSTNQPYEVSVERCRMAQEGLVVLGNRFDRILRTDPDWNRTGTGATGPGEISEMVYCLHHYKSLAMYSVFVFKEILYVGKNKNNLDFDFDNDFMGTFGRWRRAFGAIKDSTTVGLAKVSSDFKVFTFSFGICDQKNLDIAIVKATNHEECLPKDLHVKRIIVGTSFAVPRADVGYCIHAFSRRLTKTKNWIVAVKTLMVLHRILREGDPSFREELLVHRRRRKFIQIAEFRDESSQLGNQKDLISLLWIWLFWIFIFLIFFNVCKTALDCSSWIQMYAAFLEERVECFRVLGFDIETEWLTTLPGGGKAYSRTQLMSVDELLTQLPIMQQLLHRLITCQFFNLNKDDAVNALNIYKKAGQQAAQLADFYNMGKHLRVAMNIQFPSLSQPPPSFLATMEEYVNGASSNSSVSYIKLDHQVVVEEQLPQEIKEVDNKEVVKEHELVSTPQKKIEEEVPPLIVIDDNDCQDSNETTTKAAEFEDTVSQLPLTIIQPGKMYLHENENEKTSSLEIAAVTSTNNDTSVTNSISQSKPGGGPGGFDKMLLYSLYEDDIAKKQIQYEYGTQKDSLHYHHLSPQPDHFMVPGEIIREANMHMRQMSNPQMNLYANGISYPHN
ncbi:clathrin assembly protein [Artemisia annua]|uniref:Clathrin assembly protein n=1 Tax=Artemisia annua TaxID=35608 RepID=A0A2U1Q673_ARTAN|nr:clathrin assembly protein [Artemisia annua]